MQNNHGKSSIVLLSVWKSAAGCYIYMGILANIASVEGLTPIYGGKKALFFGAWLNCIEGEKRLPSLS
jgi:hypothetical protein